MSKLTPTELTSRIEQLGSWFQNICLQGIETNPSRPDHSAMRWELLEHFVPDDLTGSRALDLGCSAGYFAIKMRERGADVLGIDWHREAIDQARFAADVLALDIEYRVANIYEFVMSTEERFDYVVFMGVFYHLRYPLLVLDRLAELTRREMYFQTVIRETPGVETPEITENLTDLELLGNPGFPSLHFIENRLAGALNNWFVCNRSGIEAVLRSAGFRVIRSRGDVYVCEADRHLGESWRVSHDLTAIKTEEPSPSAHRRGARRD